MQSINQYKTLRSKMKLKEPGTCLLILYNIIPNFNNPRVENFVGKGENACQQCLQ